MSGVLSSQENVPWNCSFLQMSSCHSFPTSVSNQKLFHNSQHGPEVPANAVNLLLALTDTGGGATGTMLTMI